MADLEEITETPRTAIIDNDSNPGEEGDLARRNSPRRKRSKKRRNSGGSQGPIKIFPSNEVFEESQKGDESGGKDVRQQAESTKQGAIPTQEDHRARFYEDYHKVAEQYDKEFLKKHDEDLNTTLIFAGLFSAVTSAFIIQVDSQLQPDPNNETVALLRVLIYKIDNTTFGNDIPTLPQWTGPPRTIVQVQAILFASLAVSLFSAFLAMLGKQWLTRYQSTDMRESVIERSENRQRKLGGIVGWYFNHVMESLPLMLQASLLLLGYALSYYLLGVDLTIASVVLGVTSFGVLFYLSVVIAGTASKGCPYQTPAAHVLRYAIHHFRYHLPHVLHSASFFVSSNFGRLYHASWCLQSFPGWWSLLERPWYSLKNFASTLLVIIVLPIAPLHDLYRLGQTILRFLVVFSRRAYRKVTGRHRTAYRWLVDASPRTSGLTKQTVRLDARCILWILQTSLDKAVHLSAFKHLTSMPELAHFHPDLVVACFNIFTGCVNVSSGKVVIIQGSEQLATGSASGFFRTLHHLMTVDPASSFIADLQRRYNEVFPSEADFASLPFHPTMTKIHALVGRFGYPRDIRWHKHTPSIQEHIQFAQRMVQASREEYQRTQCRKVPRWILRFTLYFLSFGPTSPPSAVADCLSIVAIDLGCDISNVAIVEESARVEFVSTLISQKLKLMVEAADPDAILSKRKAISTLLPHAIVLEQCGQQWMIDAIFRTARASRSASFLWRQIIPYISRLFETQTPTSLNRVIALTSPYVPWDGALNHTIAVARWVAAVLAIPYTEEVGQSVVDALFQISHVDLLQPHIPIEVWAWMKRQPSLPPVHYGEPRGGYIGTVCYVRELGDADILKSYLFIVWTDQWNPSRSSIGEMVKSLREDLGGIEMRHHRKDLIERLDHILGQLDRRLEQDTPWSLRGDLEDAKKKYTRFKEVLLEVDGR